MRDRLNFTFDGFEELADRLREYGRKVDRDVRKRTVEAGYNIQREARINVPVDHGALKNSIRTYFYNRNLSAEVVAEQMYAPFVEFGTGNLVEVPNELRDYAIRFKRGGNRNQKAQPFMWPAEFKERAEYLKDLMQIVQTEK